MSSVEVAERTQTQVAIAETQEIIGRKLVMLKEKKAIKKLHKERVEDYLTGSSEYVELDRQIEELKKARKSIKDKMMLAPVGRALVADGKEVDAEVKDLKKSLNNLTLNLRDATGTEEVLAADGSVFKIEAKVSLKSGQLKLF